MGTGYQRPAIFAPTTSAWGACTLQPPLLPRQPFRQVPEHGPHGANASDLALLWRCFGPLLTGSGTGTRTGVGISIPLFAQDFEEPSLSLSIGVLHGHLLAQTLRPPLSSPSGNTTGSDRRGCDSIFHDSGLVFNSLRCLYLLHSPAQVPPWSLFIHSP